ncbi:alcohol dehydrogenase catalytic domain-containing protein [Streptomyces sp. NPDC005134]
MGVIYSFDGTGRDCTPSVPSHEVSGVVAEIGVGVTNLAVGDEIYELIPFTRDGAAAEYVAVPASMLDHAALQPGSASWSTAAPAVCASTIAVRGTASPSSVGLPSREGKRVRSCPRTSLRKRRRSFRTGHAALRLPSRPARLRQGALPPWRQAHWRTGRNPAAVSVSAWSTSTRGRSSLGLKRGLHTVAVELGGRPGVNGCARSPPHGRPQTTAGPVRSPPTQERTPQVLDVDESASRRGRTYRYLFVGFEAGQEVDVPPDRTPESFTA